MGNLMIVPVRDVAWRSEVELSNWLVQHGITPPSTEFYYELTEAVIEHTLNARLYWCPASFGVDHLLESLPWFTSSNNPVHEAQKDISDAFYEKVSEVLIDRFNEWLEALIPEKTWDIWTMRRLHPSNDVMFERGIDYRISEYYRLAQQYEPHTVIEDGRQNG